MVRIVEYCKEHQPAIDEMMRGISLEFSEQLSSNLPSYTPRPPDVYWVALHNEIVAGTVAVSAEGKYAVLKRMMVKKEFRGEALGVSKQLLQTAIDWCLTSNILPIYLGTMTQFKAAQAFYSKHGFEPISVQELPSDFVKNPVDSLFFRYA